MTISTLSCPPRDIADYLPFNLVSITSTFSRVVTTLPTWGHRTAPLVARCNFLLCFQCNFHGKYWPLEVGLKHSLKTLWTPLNGMLILSAFIIWVLSVSLALDSTRMTKVNYKLRV